MSTTLTKKPTDKTEHLVEVSFTDDQRHALESATGLTGLTGLRLVDLDSESRSKLSPGLVRVTAVLMCW